MSNPSKKKGTAAETAVVRYLLEHGIDAKRKALSGSKDQGDIELPGYESILEVKAGKQTAGYSRAVKEEWLRQTREEVKNSNAFHGYLVIKVHNRGIKDAEVWTINGRCFWYLDEFADMLVRQGPERIDLQDEEY